MGCFLSIPGRVPLLSNKHVCEYKSKKMTNLLMSDLERNEFCSKNKSTSND
ncbi:MAG: hypothetical protein HQK53_19575 [Oligoflexia bacterium]|nr:hypothetical protein [Oligoflexia bacterium]